MLDKKGSRRSLGLEPEEGAFAKPEAVRAERCRDNTRKHSYGEERVAEGGCDHGRILCGPAGYAFNRLQLRHPQCTSAASFETSSPRNDNRALPEELADRPSGDLPLDRQATQKSGQPWQFRTTTVACGSGGIITLVDVNIS